MVTQKGQDLSCLEVGNVNLHQPVGRQAVSGRHRGFDLASVQEHRQSLDLRTLRPARKAVRQTDDMREPRLLLILVDALEAWAEIGAAAAEGGAAGTSR